MTETPKVEGYEFTEEQLLEILNFIEEKRKLLFKHPESPDHVAMWQLEQHIIMRLNQISWQRYQREKGIKITKV
jgi:hypothetical protein